MTSDDRRSREKRKVNKNNNSKSSSKVDALRLLSFNAGLFEYTIGRLTIFHNPPFTWKRLYHIPSKFSTCIFQTSISVALRTVDADIIAMQEVFEERQASYLIDSLHSLYPFHARCTSGGLLAMHNGLIVFSKFPVIKSSFHSFHNITWSEAVFGSKGFLEATVDIKGVGLVTILNVHFASGTVDPESALLDSLRQEEAYEVLNAAEAAIVRSEIPMIMGDFNASPDVCPASYNTMVSHGYRDAYILTHHHNKTASAIPTAVETTNAFVQTFMTLDTSRPTILHQLGSRSRSAGSHDGVLFSSGTSRDLLSWISAKGAAAPLPIPVAAPSANEFCDLRVETSSSSSSSTAPSSVKTLAAPSTSSTEDVPAGAVASAPTSAASSAEELLLLTGGTATPRVTWDPQNTLNQLGPHSHCKPLRCDHIFLPPQTRARGLEGFRCFKANIIFDQPRVLVKPKSPFYCFWGGGSTVTSLTDNNNHKSSSSTSQSTLVTLSDHYALLVELRRI